MSVYNEWLVENLTFIVVTVTSFFLWRHHHYIKINYFLGPDEKGMPRDCPEFFGPNFSAGSVYSASKIEWKADLGSWSYWATLPQYGSRPVGDSRQQNRGRKTSGHFHQAQISGICTESCPRCNAPSETWRKTIRKTFDHLQDCLPQKGILLKYIYMISGQSRGIPFSSGQRK